MSPSIIRLPCFKLALTAILLLAVKEVSEAKLESREMCSRGGSAGGGSAAAVSSGS